MNLLHVIPRFRGGGPERDLITLAGAWRQAGRAARHHVAVLDPPISAPLLLAARRHGVTVSPARDRSELMAAIAAADVVEVSYWNHPMLSDLLRDPWPACRLVVRSVIAGSAAPQVLSHGLGDLADALVLTSSAGRRTAAARRAEDLGTPVEVVPALADMTRLESFEARAHDGVRVGYLGLVEPTKMHSRFAELCGAVRRADTSFDVFGDGTWGPEVARRFAEADPAGTLRLHGHVEDLTTAFAQMDVFGYPLAPDSYATSEKSVMEAMWAGIPPVVLAGTAPAEYIDHERSGLVVDEQDYPAGIDALASAPTMRRQLADGAQAQAREWFDPGRNAATIRRVFESTAAMPRRERAPLPGRGQSPAERFVLGLDDLAGPFRVSIEGPSLHDVAAVAAAESSIAGASPVLAQGEGGVIHHRNTHPDDPYLRLWSGLIAGRAGDTDTATMDLDFAAARGVRPRSEPDGPPGPGPSSG